MLGIERGAVLLLAGGAWALAVGAEIGVGVRIHGSIVVTGSRGTSGDARLVGGDDGGAWKLHHSQ